MNSLPKIKLPNSLFIRHFARSNVPPPSLTSEQKKKEAARKEAKRLRDQ
jgi:hypothetical protein